MQISENTVTILLHGLGRDASIMKPLQIALQEKHLNVYNISYPSKQKNIPELAKYIAKNIKERYPNKQFNFVTHSLGSIVLRYIHAHQLLPNIQRVVMLTPPNHGTPVIDFLRRFGFFRKDWGPAALQLATDDAGIFKTLPNQIDFECGILAGNKTIDPWFSWTLFRGAEDDGKVSVESTKLNGMKTHKVLPVAHGGFPGDKRVIHQVLYFLENGVFE